jgi:uncharacterized protein YxjI
MGTTVSDRALKILDKIGVGAGLDEKLLKLAEKEVRRKIVKYELMIRRFERKYNMSFPEFRDKNMVDELGHSWEVEGDFFDWELAVTELEDLRNLLKEFKAE